MAFHSIGRPGVSVKKEDEFKKYFKVYFSSWLSDLNFEMYKYNFPKNLRLYKGNEEIEVDYDNSNYFIQDKNKKIEYVKWEIKSIQGLLNWFDAVYDFYDINKFDKGSLCKNHTRERQNFIIDFKNLNDTRLKQDAFYLEYIEKFELINYLKWFDCMYLDILKTKDYLTSSFGVDNIEPQMFNAKNLEISKEDFEIIKKLVNIKTKELKTYNKVRYSIEDNQVTKVSFEGHKIANFLNNGNFDINFIQAYLNILKKEIINNDIKIIEYRPTVDYNGTEDFLNWIDKQLINVELKNKAENNNLHPSIFENGAFNIFKKWVENSNDEQDKKISFIFQKLKKEGKLRNTTFKILSEWAFSNGYLNKNTYNKLLINGCFLSPSKILTKTRLDLYNSIINN